MLDLSTASALHAPGPVYTGPEPARGHWQWDNVPVWGGNKARELDIQDLCGDSAGQILAGVITMVIILIFQSWIASPIAPW